MAEKLLKDQLNGVIPATVAQNMYEEILNGSCVLPLAQVKQMTAPTETFHVWANKPGAYWVDEASPVEITEATMIHPKMEAKKLATMVYTTREKLNDSFINVFEELKPQIVEALYREIDREILHGAQSKFGTNVMKAVTDSSHSITVGTNATIDLDVSDAMGLVEVAGYDPNGFLAPVEMKNKLRKLRDADGNRLLFGQRGEEDFYGLPIEFAKNGALDKTKAEIVVGDWDKVIVGILDGIEYSVSTDATITDGVKTVNLFQNDMIALKVTMRVAALVIKPDAFAAVVPAL